MAATNSTTNLGLPQWEATDKPERTDFNTAMSDIDNTVAAHLAESTSQIVVVTRDLSLVGTQTITTLPNRKIRSIRISGTNAGTNKTCDGEWSENGGGRCRYYFPSSLTYSTSGYPIAISNNTATDRTLGIIQNVIIGSFDIAWTKTGAGASGNSELVFLITYHD